MNKEDFLKQAPASSIIYFLKKRRKNKEDFLKQAPASSIIYFLKKKTCQKQNPA